MADRLDGVGSSSDDSDAEGKPLSSAQMTSLYFERRARRLRHPGRLPLWLNTFTHQGPAPYDKRVNSFQGMFGPGFTYDPRTNIMYTDREAVDVARALAEGYEFLIPPNMRRRPNPRGFPMNVREVQETASYVHTRQVGWQATLRLLCEFHRIAESVIIRYRDLSMHEVIDLFEHDERLTDLRATMPCPYFIPLDPVYRRTGNGSVAAGAGLAAPANGSIDDWCQYTAHHFRPNGLNPTGGIIMDMSYRVSYASVWGMLLLHFLHPVNAKNYYARYLAGIIFRPRYYVDFIRRWNRDRVEELPISVAAGGPMLRRMIFHGAEENLSEIDVIRHLAACAISQDMLDSAYPWSLAWIDQHSSVHFRDTNQELDNERRARIARYGEPTIADDFRGWWSLDTGDTHRIRALLHYERYEYQSQGRVHTQDNQYWLLRGKDSLFHWLNTFPPALPPFTATVTGLEHDEEDVPMTPEPDVATLDENTAETAPNGAADDAIMDDETTVAAATSALASDLDNTHIAPHARSE